MILGILKSIGVNSTFFYQFAAFLITYTIIHMIAFKKYVWAYSERQKRTVGDQSRAKSILEEVDELNKEFQAEARKINEQISEVFNKQREKTTQEYNSKIDQARTTAEKAKANGLADLANTYTQVKNDLSKMTGDLANLIEVRVNGGDQ